VKKLIGPEDVRGVPTSTVLCTCIPEDGFEVFTRFVETEIDPMPEPDDEEDEEPEDEPVLKSSSDESSVLLTTVLRPEEYVWNLEPEEEAPDEEAPAEEAPDEETPDEENPDEEAGVPLWILTSPTASYLC